jgi:hypothetical protein
MSDWEIRGEPMVWCAHCDQKELDGTTAADFLRFHIAWIRLVDEVGRVSGIHAALRWLHKKATS